MNRGIARRTLFDHCRDMEVFREQLGDAIERGELEVHAYCFMGTHFHLLVRSPEGQLAEAMQRVQTEYSRWFNRSRRRDGTLVRGRYRSKRIETLAYRRAVVAYIDRNPVSAGIVTRAEDYPFGSAREYGRPRTASSWLERSWVESVVIDSLELASFEPDRYPEVFGRLPEALARVVEARWRAGNTRDPLDDLLAAAPVRIRDWMRRKARLADGVLPGLPVADPAMVEAALREVSSEEKGPWRVGQRDGWLVLRAGLARDLCASRLEETARNLGVALSTARRLVLAHRGALEADAIYAERASRVAHRALSNWHPAGRPRATKSA